MLPDELGELSKVALLLQNLTAEFGFCHLAVEMRRNRVVEVADSQGYIIHQCYIQGIELTANLHPHLVRLQRWRPSTEILQPQQRNQDFDTARYSDTTPWNGRCYTHIEPILHFTMYIARIIQEPESDSSRHESESIIGYKTQKF